MTNYFKVRKIGKCGTYRDSQRFHHALFKYEKKCLVMMGTYVVMMGTYVLYNH